MTAMDLRYLRPAKLEDDAVLIRKPCGGTFSRHLPDRAAVRSGTDTLLCEAKVRVAFVAPNGRPRRQPREWVAAISNHHYRP